MKDEEDRLPHALASVSFADEVVVVDTGSRDGTREVAASAGACVEEIPWTGFVAARRHALSLARHDWIFFLDADERVSPELRAEIERRLDSPGGLAGFSMPRLSHIGGRPIRHGTWYPDRKLRLGRRSGGLRVEGGRVHETLTVDGPVARLRAPLVHHPYRDLSEGVRKASTYARLSAADRFERGHRGSAAGLLLRPPVEFLRCWLLKAGLMDGSDGFTIASLHAFYYFLRAAYLLEMARADGRERALEEVTS